jgi:hypothetical protein
MVEMRWPVKHITTKSVLLLALGLTACVGTDDGTDDADIPCGMRDCSAAEVDPEWGPEFAQLRDGKADSAGVRTALVDLTADGELDASDVLALFDEAGRHLSESELEIIREALEDTSFTVTDEARETAENSALTWGLPDDEAELVLSGDTFAGDQVPEAVTKYLKLARMHGAAAYDVNEVDDDGERMWSPYPATTPPLENMTFSYTMITPQALLDDINDTDVEYNAIVGQEMLTHYPPHAGRSFRT